MHLQGWHELVFAERAVAALVDAIKELPGQLGLAHLGASLLCAAQLWLHLVVPQKIWRLSPLLRAGLPRLYIIAAGRRHAHNIRALTDKPIAFDQNIS